MKINELNHGLIILEKPSLTLPFVPDKYFIIIFIYSTNIFVLNIAHPSSLFLFNQFVVIFVPGAGVTRIDMKSGFKGYTLSPLLPFSKKGFTTNSSTYEHSSDIKKALINYPILCNKCFAKLKDVSNRVISLEECKSES